MVGGNMRQAGSIAAAGIVALVTMVDRLKDDHASAKRLANGLHRIDARFCNPADTETNIVRVDVAFTGRNAVQWSDAMAKAGVAVSPADCRASDSASNARATIGSPAVANTSGSAAPIVGQRLVNRRNTIA